MTNWKLLIYVAAGVLVLKVVWSLVSMYTELRDFKDDMLAQQAQLVDLVRKQERQLNDVVIQETSKSTEASDAISRDYAAIVTKHGLLNYSNSSNEHMPAAANTAQSARPSKAGQSSKPSQADAERLRQCRSRLVYEAKEYDILATHYNALLSIYKQAQGVINGNSEKDDSQGSRH